MTTDILWFRFAEDTSLPEHLNQDEQKVLRHIFDPSDPQSPWSNALKSLNLSQELPEGGLVKWVGDYPYINWSYMSGLVSGGTAKLIRHPDNTYTMSQSYALPALWRLLKTHWRISSYLTNVFRLPVPDKSHDQLSESLALGICLLALQQRLNMGEEELAKALKNPEKLPSKQRQTIAQITDIQKRRTVLSSAWDALFSEHSAPPASTISAPPYFWNTPEDTPEGQTEFPPAHEKTEWKGIGVCGRRVHGKVMIISSLKDFPAIKQDDRPLILVFPYAKADTIRLFPKADGILYCNGGAMSHACTIAREQNMPCITAIGNNFMKDLMHHMNQNDPVRVEIDPKTGAIQLMDQSI